MSIAPPQRYEEDAARIDREYIPDGATTADEVSSALDEAGFPDSSQKHIEDWLVSEEDVWPEVGSNVQDAQSIERVIESEGQGTVSGRRASEIADSINSEITDARSRAAGRVDDNGVARSENGQFIGKLQNIEESVQDDGIYFTNTDTGTTARAARFNR